MRELAVSLALIVGLGLPVRALAQTTDGAGASGWGIPPESPPPETPAPNPRREPTAAPPVEEPAQPPAEPTAPRQAVPPVGLRFPVTLTSGKALVEISGPGIDEPLTCSGTCSFSLGKGMYWLHIKASREVWNMPLTVTKPERVFIDPPSTTARGVGISLILVGGSILGATLVAGTVIDENCPSDRNLECHSREEATPYLLAGFGAGLGLGAVGVVLVVGNGKPSVEVLPATDERARRQPGTFVGLGPVDGSTWPGLSLRTSF